ncbi:hypothetical protein [Dactylosporangium sp. CA-233914]|uniref:hypothetical protein n=1 Tax=Dactylosporangium sp. CA-233914 TaxID=3239934 RepID=UPI003D915F2D
MGLTLTGNLARAWLDQPDACPGCLIWQFFSWIDDDLYALIVAQPAAPGAAPCDGSATHDGMAEPAPGPRPQTAPYLQSLKLTAHLPNCPAAPQAPDRIAPHGGVDARQGGDSA